MKDHSRLVSVLLALLVFSACRPAGMEDREDARGRLDQSRRLVSEQEFDKAMDLAIQVLEEAEEAGDKALKADALCTVSQVDLMATRDAQSWENACAAEKLARAENLYRPLCEALILKGRVCTYAAISEDTNRDDEALVYLQEAYQISEEHGLSREHVQSCYHLSEAYVNKNRWNKELVPEYYDRAGWYLDEGERIAAADSLKDLTRRSVSFRIRYLRQGGRTEEAVSYCEKSLFMSESMDWLSRQQIYDQLTTLYSELGEQDLSLESHRQYVYAMQQYMRQKSDSSLEALENQYAYLLKQRQIERNRRLIAFLLSVIGFLALFSLQARLFNRKIRQQNKALEEADASKKNLLEAISSDLVDVTSLSGVNEMMELARNSYSMNEEDIRSAVKDMVGKSSTLNEDVSEYFYKLIMHRKTSVEASGLTERELEILRLSAQGLPAAQIAEMLHISPRTVTNHKQNIYTKMGVKSTPEMIYKAKEAGLL